MERDDMCSIVTLFFEHEVATSVSVNIRSSIN